MKTDLLPANPYLRKLGFFDYRGWIREEVFYESSKFSGAQTAIVQAQGEGGILVTKVCR